RARAIAVEIVARRFGRGTSGGRGDRLQLWLERPDAREELVELDAILRVESRLQRAAVGGHGVEHALAQGAPHLRLGGAAVGIGPLKEPIERALGIDLLAERRRIAGWKGKGAVAVVLDRTAPGDAAGVVRPEGVRRPGVVRAELQR